MYVMYIYGWMYTLKLVVKTSRKRRWLVLVSVCCLSTSLFLIDESVASLGHCCMSRATEESHWMDMYGPTSLPKCNIHALLRVILHPSRSWPGLAWPGDVGGFLLTQASLLSGAMRMAHWVGDDGVESSVSMCSQSGGSVCLVGTGQGRYLTVDQLGLIAHLPASPGTGKSTCVLQMKRADDGGRGLKLHGMDLDSWCLRADDLHVLD